MGSLMYSMSHLWLGSSNVLDGSDKWKINSFVNLSRFDLPFPLCLNILMKSLPQVNKFINYAFRRQRCQLPNYSFILLTPQLPKAANTRGDN